MLKRSNQIASAILALAIIEASPILARACGMAFPNRLLITGDKGALWMPLTTFSIEVSRIKPKGKPRFAAKPLTDGKDREFTDGQYHFDAMRADLAELEEALQYSGLSKQGRQPIIEEYRRARTAINNFACSKELASRFKYPYWKPRVLCRDAIEAFSTPCLLNFDDWQLRRGWNYVARSCPEIEEYSAPDPNVSAPPGTPEEFALYLQSASLYYQKDWPEAQKYWLKILELPPDQRRYKSVWAAFMMGKTLFESDPDKAMGWFRQVRALAQAGCTDSLGLAAETYIWEGKYNYDRNQHIEAVNFFATAHAAGYGTNQAYLRRCALQIIRNGPEAMREAARDPLTRQVVSVYFSSYFDLTPEASQEFLNKWLEILEQLDVRDLITADAMAWTAYQNGDWNLARRWLKRGSSQSALSNWIQAKLCLREGRLGEAARCLRRARSRMAETECWRGVAHQYEYVPGINDDYLNARSRILAELGAVQLSQGEFIQSLDSFVRASSGIDYWLDAAYVAEKVLTLKELKTYVDHNWRNPGPPPVQRSFPAPGEIHAQDQYERATWIRYLLARRLARVGRWQEAMTYYPQTVRPRFDAYIQFIRQGHDRHLPAEERMKAFWEAGEIARHEGRSLLEIEIDPDWLQFPYHDDLPHASVPHYGLDHTSRRRLPESPRQIFNSTDVERRRVRRHTEEAGRYYQWRYAALSHYLSASAYMPDENDETARRLCEVGSWMKYMDPQVADIFYKALVWRNWSTKLGREANEKRWFPRCEGEEGEKGKTGPKK
jgi:tetratricopeptide (TPR) repeat protein